MVYCSTPFNSKGILISAIEDNDPVIFFEPKRCYRGPFYGDPHNDDGKVYIDQGQSEIGLFSDGYGD